MSCEQKSFQTTDVRTQTLTVHSIGKRSNSSVISRDWIIFLISGMNYSNQHTLRGSSQDDITCCLQGAGQCCLQRVKLKKLTWKLKNYYPMLCDSTYCSSAKERIFEQILRKRKALFQMKLQVVTTQKNMKRLSVDVTCIKRMTR